MALGPEMGEGTMEGRTCMGSRAGDARTERVALISDVHGNMPALEAVLADIDRRGIDRVLCLGDLVGKGPHSDRAVDVCRARCEGVVRGNWDDWIVAAANDHPIANWHRRRLGVERLAYLTALPNAIDVVLGGRRVRLLHASPSGVYHRVFANDPDEKLLAMFDDTAFTGRGFAPEVVAYGDIHVAYMRTFSCGVLLNVGSAGNSFDLPLACYAILEGAPKGELAAPLAISLVRLAYDIERAVREAEADEMPDLRQYAEELRTARFQLR